MEMSIEMCEPVDTPSLLMQLSDVLMDDDLADRCRGIEQYRQIVLTAAVVLLLEETP